MLGYVCKYTPIEALQCFGEEVVRIEPAVSGFARADALMHPNICTYAKAVLEEIMSENTDKELDGIILVTCCDSVRRLYDVLKSRSGGKYVYMIDVPRKNVPSATDFFANEIKKLIRSYGDFSGKTFDGKRLPKSDSDIRDEGKNGAVNIALMGARCKSTIFETIEKTGAVVACDFTCMADKRESVRFAFEGDEEKALFTYAQSLLNSYPCLRMADTDSRLRLMEEGTGYISGVIYHTVKFCDSYSYEYAQIKDKLSVPVLKIETDYTEQCEGQIRTRIEAFIEALIAQSQETPVLHTINEKSGIPNSAAPCITGSCLVAGIDSGSTSTNAVIMDDSKRIISCAVVRTGAKSIDSADKAFNEVLAKAGLTKEQVSMIVSTGYGRISIPFADKNVTEITCHGKGAHFINKNIRTVIDIGGQDSKIVRVNDQGEVIDFAMNDKCAAGTGRFLEMMARTLEISIEDMGPLSQKWKEEINITNMCTVFAESEVISLIAQNKEKTDIIYGLCNSVARKTVSLLGKVGKVGGYMMTGGVAKNFGVVKAIESRLGDRIFIYDEPELVGAIGAALMGLEEMKD